MTTEEKLREELEAEKAARQELDEALQKAAEYGQQLMAQVQEQERTIQEYREKEQETPKSQVQRRQSTTRRASTISFTRSNASGEDGDGRTAPRRVGFLPGSPDSDEERPSKSSPRRARGGQTVVVEDLMQHNQSLEEDLRRLQENYQKLQEDQEGSEEDEDEDAGYERKTKRRSRKVSSVKEEDELAEVDLPDPRLQEQAKEIEELRQALSTAKKDAAKQLQTLEAELESKKQEAEEIRASQQVAKSDAAQSEAKCKVLQEKLQVLVEDGEKHERELQIAKAKERDLKFQLEEQALRNKARDQRKWMPTACEEALHSAAARASLADEFQDIEEDEAMETIAESNELEEQDEGDAEESTPRNKAEASKEVQGLQEELAAAKADAESSKEVAALCRQQLQEAQAETSKEMQVLQEELAAAKADAESSKEVAALCQQQLQEAQAETSKEMLSLREELAAAQAAQKAQAQLKAEAGRAQDTAELQQAEAKAERLDAAKDIRDIADELAGLRAQVETFQAMQQKEAESYRQKLEEFKELEAAKQEDMKQQLALAKEQAQLVSEEKAKLQREISVFREAASAPAEPERQDPEETFWDRVMASIACARTTAKPPSAASSGRAGVADVRPESIRLSMPNETAR